MWPSDKSGGVATARQSPPQAGGCGSKLLCSCLILSKFTHPWIWNGSQILAQVLGYFLTSKQAGVFQHSSCPLKSWGHGMFILKLCLGKFLNLQWSCLPLETSLFIKCQTVVLEDGHLFIQLFKKSEHFLYRKAISAFFFLGMNIIL